MRKRGVDFAMCKNGRCRKTRYHSFGRFWGSYRHVVIRWCFVYFVTGAAALYNRINMYKVAKRGLKRKAGFEGGFGGVILTVFGVHTHKW